MDYAPVTFAPIVAGTGDIGQGPPGPQAEFYTLGGHRGLTGNF